MSKFLTSASTLAQCPNLPGREVAVIGRSNVGKSSLLNVMLEDQHLVRRSRTPGRTQLINFFAIDEEAFLVDLPGYGYAGVPREVRAHWDVLVGEYVFHRETLAGVVVVMDSRHPLTPQDLRLLDWLLPSGRSVHMLLSKSDKLSAQVGHRTLVQVRKDLARIYPGATAQLFSSLKRTGTAEALACIEAWVAAQKQKAPAKGE